MPKWYRLNTSGQWSPLKLYRLNTGGTWDIIKKAYRLNTSGGWDLVHTTQDVPVATTSPTLTNQVSSTTNFYGGDVLTLTRGAYTNTTANSDTTYRMRIYKGTNQSLALNDSNWTVVKEANYTGANSTSSTSISSLASDLTDGDAYSEYYYVGEVRVNNDANTSGSENYDFETTPKVLSRISFSVSGLTVSNVTNNDAYFEWTISGISTNSYLYSQNLIIRETGPTGTIKETISLGLSDRSYTLTNSANLSSSTTYYAVIEVVANDGWRLTASPTKLTDNEYFVTLSDPPVNTIAPTIGPLNNRTASSGYLGYLPVSTTLTADKGAWNNTNVNTTYSYNWYLEDSAGGALTNTGYIGNTKTYAVGDVGDYVFVNVKATNSDGSFGTASSGTYILNQAVSVGTISPTSVTKDESNNFTFAISHYPTSYTINWGDGTTDYSSGAIAANTSTVNASVAHTYSTSGTYTITVTAQPGNKTNTASITVSEAAPGPVRNLTRVSDALAGVATDKKFTWDAPNTGGSVSKYQHKINSGSWIDVPGGGTQTFVELYSFNTGISNTVSIRAVGPGGNGAATDSGPFTLPVITTGPSYSSITSSQAIVSWTSSNQSTYSLAITSAPATPYTGTTQTSRTISSLTPNTAYSGSLSIASSTSDTHTKSVSFTTLRTGLTPTFGTNTRTADGFTGSVTNFDSNYTWNIATSAGSVAFGTATGATRPFTVTGVSAGSSATVTVTTSRTGYDSGSATTTESALNAALTPTFGTLTRGNGRIDSSVSNYSASYTWSGSASVGTFAWGTPSGSSYPFSVTGLSDDQSTTVTITTTRSGYVNGSATQTGSSLATGLTPTFGTNTSGSGNFAGSVTNYNSDYSWSMSASVGTFTWGAAPANNPGTRTFTVTGLTSAQSSTVTATTTRTGFNSASATTTGAALTTGLTPTFGTNTRTSDGFTGSVNNYSSSYTWSISTSAGSVAFGTASGSSYPFTVTGLSANTSATVTVTTSRTGYTSVSATTTESSLLTGLTPTFGTNTRGNKKIDGSVSNYSSSYTWSGSASNGTFAWGTVSGSTYPFSVTSLTDGQSTTVTVTTSRTNYTSVSATTTESALNAGLTPTFGANASAVGGFAGSVTNYNSDYSWSSSLDPTTATFTWGTAPSTNPGTRTFTVSGLSAGASGTLTLTTTRSGYNSGSASTTGTAQEGLTVPGVPSMVYDSVNNTATNYAYDISWTASSGSGTIVYQLECQPSTNGSTANGQPTVIRPSTGSYSTNSAQNVLVPKTSGGVQNLYWRARARASNDNGSTWTAWSSYASSFS